MECGSVVKAIYEFRSDVDGELQLQIGDIIQVIERIDKHWTKGISNGIRGNFPSGFVVDVRLPTFTDNQQIFCALNDFIAQENGDLSFSKGELIVGLEAIDSNWWKGQTCPEFRGIFPLTHVWQLDSAAIRQSMYPKKVSFAAKAKSDMRAQLPEEINLRKGDDISIFEAVDKDWYRGTCNGQTGLIPSGFVIIIERDKPAPDNDSIHQHLREPISDSLSSTIADEDETKPDDRVNTNYDRAAPIRIEQHYGYDSLNSGILPYGRTLTPFSNDFPNELSFKSGELIQLIKHVDDYWMEGEIDGKIGLFPKKSIKIIVDCPDIIGEDIAGLVSSEDNRRSSEERLNVLDLPNDTYGRLLFDFEAQLEGDLNLKLGDTVTLLRQLNLNWYEALADNGQIGLCPANFIEIIGADLTSSADRRDSDAVSLDLRTTTTMTPRQSLEPSFDSFDEINFLSNSKDNSDSWSLEENDCRTDFARSTSFSGDLKRPASTTFGILSKKASTRAPPLKTQMSLPTLSDTTSNNLHGSDDWSTTITSGGLTRKPSYPRRSAPAAPSRFPDVLEERSTAVTLKDTISDKCELIKRYERIKIKLESGLNDETDSNAGNIEFKRQIEEYNLQIKILQTEIETLNNRLSTLEESGSVKNENQLDINKERRVAQFKKDEQKRKDLEKIKKDLEQRQCIITELLQTERDYLQDIQLCYRIFLQSPEEGKALGVDMVTLFGNLDDVIDVATRLKRRLEKCCQNRSADQQVVGDCFVDSAEDLKEAYGHYCRNHDEVIPLLDKYESNPAIRHFINGGVEKMKETTNCFDLQSVLIKPVQRILKYPMLLNELNKYTIESHIDKKPLKKAVLLMADVAMAINEFKRKKDLVFKYRKDADTSLSSRFSKLTLHSVRKKYARIGTRLSTTFGLSNVIKDERFAEAEKKFHTVEKTLKIFLKDITAFVKQMEELYKTVLNVSEDIAEFYRERKTLKEVDQLRSAHRIIFSQFWEDFKQSVEKRVIEILKQMLQLFQGPRNLIQKRYDKLLDYDSCENRLKNNKDTNKLKSITEETRVSKQNYEALNSQLLEELPELCSTAVEMLHDCISHFLCARRIFIGRSAREVLNLMELPSLIGCKGDILEVFRVKHNLVVDTLVQLSLVPKHLFPSATKIDIKPRQSPKAIGSRITNNNQSPPAQLLPQSPGQQAYVKSQFPIQLLFNVVESFLASDLLDLTIHKGDIVGVVKQKDPMGNPNRWFVKNGVSEGFVPARILQPFAQTTSVSSTLKSSPSSTGASPHLQIRRGTPSPDLSRYSNISIDRISLSSGLSDSADSPLRTKKDILNLSVNSTEGRAASPRYAEVDEFDPYSSPPDICQRYDHVPESICNYNRYEEVAEKNYKSPPSTKEEEEEEEDASDINRYEEVEENVISQHRYELIPGEINEEYDEEGKGGDQKSMTGSFYENSGDEINATKRSQYFYALYHFSAIGPNQLSLTQGQVVLLHHACDLHGNNEWWFVEDRYGNQGYVPSNYLSIYTAD